MENALVVQSEIRDLEISRNPSKVLEEAKGAAKALAEVIRNKKKPVMVNGEQYLEFEDWQTVGRFYGITAKVVSTGPIEMGNVKGFEAKAVAIHVPTGQEISGADAMCMNDEQNWKTRPMFMLRSMAQTRACSKVLRNVLAWVVVMAGYKPTPAEEMGEIGQSKSQGNPKIQAVKIEPSKVSASIIDDANDVFFGEDTATNVVKPKKDKKFPSIVRAEGRIDVLDSFTIKEELKKMGYRWNGTASAWSIDDSPENLKAICDFLGLKQEDY